MVAGSVIGTVGTVVSHSISDLSVVVAGGVGVAANITVLYSPWVQWLR